MAKKTIKLKNKNSQKVAIGMFKEALYNAGQREAFQQATEFKGYIKNTIKKQRYNWKPLSEPYKQHKENKRLDPRIYIASGETLSKIIVKKTKRGYFVGMAEGKHSKAGLEYGTLMAIHEWGNSTNPARPIWRPAISVFSRRGKLIKDVKST
jgi:hypothetical protein